MTSQEVFWRPRVTVCQQGDYGKGDEDNPGLFVFCATYARWRDRQESSQYEGLK